MLNSSVFKMSLTCFLALILLQSITLSLQETPINSKNNGQESKQVHRYSSTLHNQANIVESRYNNDKSFIKDIVDRLHALDADIGKLLYNSTSMYSPDVQSMAFQENIPKGGERFSEVLADLDSLQDEIGVLVSNATRTRQYNILVRLRPLNTILYRIRHNLHLIRNSLVAINTVAGLEKLGNSVLDSTLETFMRPDANVSEEFEDSGNYDINLDKLDDSDKRLISTSISPATTLSTTTSTTPATTTITTITNTTTTPKPITNVSTTERSVSTRRTSRPRRVNNRRTTTSTTTTTQKPYSLRMT